MKGKASIGGLTVCAALLAVASCSSAGAAASASGADQTFKTSKGHLSVALQVTPDPPVPGLDSAEYVVTDATTGAPVEGLSIAIVPWMPAMGHGTSITPTATDMGGGHYQITDLSLFMPGEWELRTTFSGQVDDSAAPTFDVP